MNMLELVSYMSIGVPAEDMSDFDELEQCFHQSCEELADGFFSGVTENIGEALRLGSSNSLCVVLVCCLLVVLAFHIVPPLLRVFLSRF